MMIDCESTGVNGEVKARSEVRGQIAEVRPRLQKSEVRMQK
jgi:hypothetical protein